MSLAAQALPAASLWGGGEGLGTGNVLHGSVRFRVHLGASRLLGDRIGPGHEDRGPQVSAHPETPAPISGLSVGAWELGAGWQSPGSHCGELRACQGPGCRELSDAARRCGRGVGCGSCSRLSHSVASHLGAASAVSSPTHLSEQMRDQEGGDRAMAPPTGSLSLGDQKTPNLLQDASGIPLGGGCVHLPTSLCTALTPRPTCPPRV